jgi:hypothetical protein
MMLERISTGPIGFEQRLTLEDAAGYIMKRSKAEQKRPEWEAATEALIMAAEEARATDARARRHAAGTEPERRTRVRQFTQRPAFGKAEAEAGSIAPDDAICRIEQQSHEPRNGGSREPLGSLALTKPGDDLLRELRKRL